MEQKQLILSDFQKSTNFTKLMYKKRNAAAREGRNLI